MKRAIVLAFGAALGTALYSAAMVLPVQTQAATVQAPYKAPRNGYGQPDLGTYWSNVSMTPESRPAAFGDRLAYTPEEVAKIEGDADKMAIAANLPTDPKAGVRAGQDDPAPGGVKLRPEFAAAGGNVGGYNYGWLDPGSRVMRVGGEPRTSILTTHDGRAPPVKPGVTVERIDYRSFNNFDNPETRSLGERCVMGFGRNAGPPMLANGFYNNDYKFIQSADTVAIEVEMNHDVRLVRLNGTHRTDGLRPYMGDSIGHWEGETLVVETTNLPQSASYHGSWKNLTVTERFTRVAPNRILYQFTITDPTMWDKPWGGEYEFAPLKGIIYEYACHEGTYALEDMLAGARAEDAAAAAKAKAATPAATVAH